MGDLVCRTFMDGLRVSMIRADLECVRGSCQAWSEDRDWRMRVVNLVHLGRGFVLS